MVFVGEPDEYGTPCEASRQAAAPEGQPASYIRESFNLPPWFLSVSRTSTARPREAGRQAAAPQGAIPASRLVDTPNLSPMVFVGEPDEYGTPSQSRASGGRPARGHTRLGFSRPSAPASDMTRP